MTDKLKKLAALAELASAVNKSMDYQDAGDLAAKFMKNLGFDADLVDEVRKDVEKEAFDAENNTEGRARARVKAKELLVNILGMMSEDEFEELADKTDAEFENRERIAKGEEEKSGFDKFIKTMAAAQNKSEKQLKDEMSSAVEKEVDANVDMLIKCFVRQIKECPSIVPNGLTSRILKACEEEDLNAFIAMKALCNTPFDVIATK